MALYRQRPSGTVAFAAKSKALACCYMKLPPKRRKLYLKLCPSAEFYMKGFIGNDFVPARLKCWGWAKGTGIWLISLR